MPKKTTRVPRRGSGGPTRVPAFKGRANADPKQELDGTPTALAIAIAEAAMAAAAHLTDVQEDEADFEVSSIRITVKKNPGPTSYKVTLTPL